MINLPGKGLGQKHLVFESDDWGSIRIPGRNAYDYLSGKGLIKANDPFSRYDTLEGDADMEALFSVLSKYRDASGGHPVITANTVMANPDFNKIHDDDYRSYHYEVCTTTYASYEGSGNVFQLIKEGMTAGVYHPQFHAREHLNYQMWLELLRQGDAAFIDAFRLKCFSIDYSGNNNRRNNIMAAYDYYSPESFAAVDNSIRDGLRLFREIFGFRSATTVAPCYVWDNKVEQVMQSEDVKGLQGSRYQLVPQGGKSGFAKRFHYSGQSNAAGQKYFLRNGLFEPSINENIDWVDKCMESIEIAFRWKKPAIIGTHRINFVGGIFQHNRDNNLKMLDELLRRALKKWPDLNFTTTDKLLEKY